MEFKEYYISDKDKKSNCIIRTFCKLLNKEYDDVKNELLNIAIELNYERYVEIEVFETYLERNNYTKYVSNIDIKVKDLKLPIGKYAVFCYDKKDYYHMLSIIDNIVYDKNDTSLDLYVINVYKHLL